MLNCSRSNARKHIRDFTSVAIRHWLQRDRHTNVAVCYDCHYPTCAMPSCGKTPEHAVVWNSWVSKADFLRQATDASTMATDIFRTQDKRWFCEACKIPPCPKQIAKDCLRTRAVHRHQRFQKWTCKSCEQVINDMPCNQGMSRDTEAWWKQYDAVRTYSTEHGRLPPYRSPLGRGVGNMRTPQKRRYLSME